MGCQADFLYKHLIINEKKINFGNDQLFIISKKHFPQQKVVRTTQNYQSFFLTSPLIKRIVIFVFTRGLFTLTKTSEVAFYKSRKRSKSLKLLFFLGR